MTALICGKNWNNGSCAGARTVNANNYPWNVNPNIGVRLACDEENCKKKRYAATITVASQ